MMKVNEIFESFQFEGSRSGTLNTFIRFSGCNRRCDFCDTEHEEYTEYSPYQIVDIIKRMSSPNVILTGGEPLYQNQNELVTLVELLQEEDIFISMETNGDFLKETNDLVTTNIDWITCSPKTKLDSDSLMLVDEIKYIIPYSIPIIEWNFYYKDQIFLQPEWKNDSAIHMCMELIKHHPEARLSIQTHKYLGIK